MSCGIETWPISRVSNNEHLPGKIMQKNMHQKLFSRPFLILLYNLKQPLHVRNFYKSNMS